MTSNGVSVTSAADEAISGNPSVLFDQMIHDLAAAHRPSRMPFFARLAAIDRAVATDPKLLGQLHLVYQASMHATRAAVYYLPHLDSPAMRKRKLQIFVDDDGLPGGDTHHYQLTRVFAALGAELLLGDEEFGDPELLCRHLDATTAAFVRLAKTLYSRSLGAWCVVEVMSDDWMRALADGLAAHFPAVRTEPYFADCFSQHVEERHADESLDVTKTILRQRPELLTETLDDAATMAAALDGVWGRLDELLDEAQARVMRTN
jgi:pyrroloquinoline quinone (PQQ) biosynthesis protein C